MDSDQEFHAKTLFHQGSYAACHAAITAMKEPSFGLLLFSARSLIALKKTQAAMDLMSPHHDSEPSARAISLLATTHNKPPSNEEEREKLSEAAEALTEEIQDEENDGPDSILRVTLAAVLILAENITLAIFLLNQGVQLRSLEAVALLASLYLSPRLRRPDLARTLYRSVKGWADDAILLQMVEAWIGATTGSAAACSNGREPGGYQSAFYVFDEISNTSADQPGQVNLVCLNGKAVTQLAMGHVDEAHASLTTAFNANPEDENTLASLIVISAHLDHGASNPAEYLEKLKTSNPSHPLIIDLGRREALFDEAARQFLTSTA